MAPSRLDALVEVVTDKVTTEKDPDMPYVGLEHIATGSPDLLGTAPSSSSISTNSVFAAGDTLYGKLRPNLRKAVMAPFAGYCSTDVLVLRARAGVEPSYVGRLFQSESVIAAAVRTASGTKMPRTSWAALRGLRVHHPAQGVQRRVGEILDTLDDAIRKTEHLIAKLKQVKQGLLHDLLTRGIDDNGELRDPARHSEEFTEVPELGRIPRAWAVRPFGELCESSAFGPRFPSDRYSSEGALATLRTTDMDDDGKIELSTMPRANIDPREFAQHLLQRDDLVISRSGTCGIAGVFPGYVLPVVPGAFLIRFRMRERVAAHLFRRYFNSPQGRPRLDRLAIGGVQKNIKGSEVMALRVPCPGPEEAIAIASVVDAAEATVASNMGGLTTLRLLKRGLMEDLLTGRVRVSSHESAA